MHVNNSLPATPTVHNAHHTLERTERKEQSQINALVKRFIRRGDKGRFIVNKHIVAIVL